MTSSVFVYGLSVVDFDAEELEFLMANDDEDEEGAMEGDEKREMLVAFRRHKNAYYTGKMHIDPVDK